MNSLWIALLQLKRSLSSWRSVLTGIIVPAVIVLLLSLAAGRYSSDLTIPVLNQDRGPLGEELLRSVSRDIAGIRFIAARSNETPWMIVPSDFSSAAAKGNAGSIIIKDTPESVISIAIQNNLTMRISKWEEQASLLRKAGIEEAEVLDRLVKETSFGKSERFSVLNPVHVVDPWMRTASGMAIVFIMMFVSGTVVHILDDRDRHTMLRMFSTPLRSREIALGYILGSLITGSLQVLVLLIVIHFGTLGNFRLVGGIWLILESFLLAAIGLSCALGSVAKSGRSLSGFVTVTVIPTCMLGGCFWPIEIMPGYMQKLAAFVPQSWALDAWMRASVGDPPREYAYSILLLLLFAAVLLSIGASILKTEDAESRP